MIKTRNFCLLKLRHTYAEVDGFVSNSQKGWSPSRLTSLTVEMKDLSSYTCVAACASNSKNEAIGGLVSLMDKAQPPT